MVIVYILLGILLLLAGLFLYSIAPRRRRNTEPFNHTFFAHRGLHTEDGEAPENSLASFERAKLAGYGVELDIQFTADRQIVVFHDKDLSRMCDVNKRVDSLTYDELKELTLQGGQERIPLLQDALEVLDDTPVLCEIKSYGANADTSLCKDAWPLLEQYKGPLCIESFNPFMVRWFRKNQPQVIRGILSTCYDDVDEVTFWQGVALGALMTNFLTKPDFVAYDYQYRNKFPFVLCRSLFRPMTAAWTITDKEQETTALKTFDTCIFEQYYPKKRAIR